MSEFQLYYGLGLDHILDVKGYDHILFVVAFTALYQISDWKKVLVLVTAFTVGHSITLALATLDLVHVNSALIEFMIPCTIVVTSVGNLFVKESNAFTKRKIAINYFFAGFFGLIHGLGFSNYLKGLLGRDNTIVTQLFAFNIGLEVGQIIVVGIFLAISFLFVSVFGVSRRDWKTV
ncbi:MAG: HupE/UreJ family protein, partial [Cyclobacteriaceae bacterium]|nr:HupE/UreJ family protein [Cyclobacteriaceae bacterium HetDA_MAG_MS6]